METFDRARICLSAPIIKNLNVTYDNLSIGSL